MYTNKLIEEISMKECVQDLFIDYLPIIIRVNTNII